MPCAVFTGTVNYITHLQGFRILIFLPVSSCCSALSLPPCGSPPPPQPRIPAPMAKHSTSFSLSSHSPFSVTFGGVRPAASSFALSSAELLGQNGLSLASCSFRTCEVEFQSPSEHTSIHVNTAQLFMWVCHLT